MSKWTEEKLRKDSNAWCMPLEGGHIEESPGPEELLVNPEDLDIVPEEVQAGCQQWTLQTDQGIQFQGSNNWTQTEDLFGLGDFFYNIWTEEGIPAGGWYLSDDLGAQGVEDC